ncbi:MAG TPA: M56 family metallopeptidase [Thermoanaerobaculia bacterium]|nr:M56 family metallopeptidase [Thermoanaerobaculia bacterium]
MLHFLTTSRGAGQALAWLLTYAVHSTLLLAMAWAVTQRMGGSRLRLQETVWRCALAGALVTASAQLAFVQLGHAPIAGRWSLALPGAPAVAAASGSPGSGATGPAGERFGVPEAPGVPGPARLAATAAAAGPGSPVGWQAAGAVRPAAAAAGPRPAQRAWLPPLEASLLTAWLLGALALSFGTVRSYLSLRRRLRYRPEVVGGGVLARLASLARGSGISRRVRLTCTWRLRVPVALGLREAEVCVPLRVLFQLDDEQQDALLAHELAHLVRRDPVWLPLTQLVAGVFFFQPLNWLARRRLRELSELLCDEWAVSRTGRPLSLAACLAEVAAWSLHALGVRGGPRHPARLPVPGMADRPSQLAYRIRRLLDGVSPDGGGPDGRRLAIVLAVVLLAVTLAAPGIYAGSFAAVPASPGAGADTPAGKPAASGSATSGAAQAARVGLAAQRSASSSVPHAAMVVAAMTPALEQEAGDAATAPAAGAGYESGGNVDQGAKAAAAAPAAASVLSRAPAAAAAFEPDAERARLAAAADRLEHLDKLGTLSQEQLDAIAATVERISHEIDAKLGAELERLNHQLSSARAAGPHGKDLPGADLPGLDAELAELTAKLRPSAKEMADLDVRLRDLDAQLPHLSAEEIKRFHDEAKHALEQMPKLGFGQAEMDRMHAELGRALERMPKAGLSHEEIEHLRADVKRAVEESAAAWSHGLSPAERKKMVADARRLAEHARPNEAQLEALRALQHAHEELSRVLADQRAEIEAVRREILQQTEALRAQSRHLAESRRLHPKPKPDHRSRPAAPPGGVAPQSPGGPGVTAPPAVEAPAAAEPPPAAAPPRPTATPDSAGPPPPGACES